MSRLLSRRGRVIKAKAELARHLEEKYLAPVLPLSSDEKAKVQRVFDEIRRQLKGS